MYLTEESIAGEQHRAGLAGAGVLPWRSKTLEPQKHCAYNQTRECFLGLEIEAADLSETALAERMKSLVLRSGEGLWLQPYQGLPAAQVPAPLDMIYLDEEGRVLETVESFPTFRAAGSGVKPASVLALPAHSIFASQTQAGDQLVVCAATEMERRLADLSAERSSTTSEVRGAVLLREQPLWSGGPGVLEKIENPPAQSGEAAQRHEIDLAKPGSHNGKPPRNWFQRWWSPDPRRAPRKPGQGLAAYYWNGAAPEAHGIRDISSSGLYLVTEERWYPGTLVLMTLQRTDCGEEVKERSVAVLSRAVRWGQDGVGLQFVLHDEKDTRREQHVRPEGANKKELEHFLQQLRKG